MGAALQAVENRAYAIGKCGTHGVVQIPGSSQELCIRDGSRVAVAKVPEDVRTAHGLPAHRVVPGTFEAARPGQEAMIRFPCTGRYVPLSRLANHGIAFYYGVVNEARI